MRKRGKHSSILDTDLRDVFKLLIMDMPLPPKNVDHKLHGEYADCRDCYVTPDLVLIYRKIGDDILQLVRIGSHSELF